MIQRLLSWLRHGAASFRRDPGFGPAIVAAIAWLSIVISIDPLGSYPSMPEGPGLTIDESFNAQQGVYLVEAIRNYWLRFLLFDFEAVREVFGDEVYLQDHPPLGRLWLGLHHHLWWWLFPPFEPGASVIVACARPGAASAFAILIWWLGRMVALRWGWLAGVIASVVLVLMPRVYGHAHLAALETCTNLTCFLATWSVATYWNKPQAPGWKMSLLAGVCWGLALLTKIQGVLIAPPIAVWALVRWRQRAVLPLLIWGVTGLVTYFVGWPWLWLDPLVNVKESFVRSGYSSTLTVLYLGTEWKDLDVPWHYPFMITAFVTPELWLMAAAAGYVAAKARWWKALWAGKTAGTSTVSSKSAGPQTVWSEAQSDAQSRSLFPALPSETWWDTLWFLQFVFPLVVFAVPGVRVYDGERLFLIAFPPLAILVTRGLVQIGRWMEQYGGQRAAVAAIVGICAVTGFDQWRMHPVYLSYFNSYVELAGGPGRLGLQANYWGDAVTRSFIESALGKDADSGIVTRSELASVLQFPKLATVEPMLKVTPILHQFQQLDLRQQSPRISQLPTDHFPVTQREPKLEIGPGGDCIWLRNSEGDPQPWMRIEFGRDASSFAMPQRMVHRILWSTENQTTTFSTSGGEFTAFAVIERKRWRLAQADLYWYLPKVERVPLPGPHTPTSSQPSSTPAAQ